MTTATAPSSRLRRRASRAVGLLLAVALLSLPAPALAEGESEPAPVLTLVTGRFVDSDGWPVAGLQVDEESFTIGETATTRADGTFTLKTGPTQAGPVSILWSDPVGDFDGARVVVPSVTPGQTKDAGTIHVWTRFGHGRAPHAIATSSRAAVTKAYRKQFQSRLRREKPVTVHGCSVRATPKALQKRDLSAVNLFRSMAGLARVRLDPKLSARARKAALIQYHQGYLEHFPARSARCWTKAGSAASSESNLSMGDLGASNMNGYMIDPGLSNYAAGHRRWILSPGLTRIGSGYAGTFNALHVLSPSRDANPTPRWITWPTAGYFPAELEPWGRWSFMSARSDLSFTGADVSVTIKGKRQKLHVYRKTSTYGNQQGLVWDLKKWPTAHGKKVTTAVVTVSGVRLRGATTLPPVSYPVKLFWAGRR